MIMNLLFTSVGRRSYLIKYFREALKEYSGEIHVMNSSNISPVFQLADKAVVSPLIYDKNYIPFCLKYCSDNAIDAIISLFDVDLPILSANKEKFSQIGTRVVVSDYNVIDICNDKWKTYKFLTDNGFNAPKTYCSLDCAINAIKSDELSFPLIVKPRWGMGSIGIFVAEDEEELKVFYKKTKKDIFNTYLKYESALDIDNCVLIQEKLLGEEYGMDIINNLEGEYQNTIVKRKFAMRSGETDCAVTVDNLYLKNTGKKISEKLRHIANLDVDVFLCNEKAYILEMNARFGGGYPFSHMAGVNLPLAIVKWLNNEKVDKNILTAQSNIMCQKDIRMVKLNNSADAI